ncbi:class I SAM-dependent methyltransferase [Cupriavidus gilardii]|uniref:class I SAM-dependent methyltransferase n=1 Tax=Cupriavidus gilardii TaxID=82541 RepID=UPI001580EA40|nr:SAM-dependent methyltransferase [Cupriavidus gilardii]MCT9071306.1 SAM-dependent methyltransferase [Cupriavidus gilardii]MCT9073151.1 SAM-dependent methyltransferase [Cupriavidus gilardii]QKS60794.1 SAM-dependent methyltransferase [Cupriavidus gilardii]
MSQTETTALAQGRPSTTALMMAIARAVHQLLDEPIVLPDPVALPILGPELERAVRDDPYRYNDPMARPMRAAVVARAMVADAELAEASRAGVRQCVVLGAGLDTLAWRVPATDDGMRVFEVDHPATQAWKQDLMRQAALSLPDWAKSVSADLQHASLQGVLEEAGFRGDRPACFVWLGVTPYLTDSAIEATLRYVASLPPGTRIVFDYRVDAGVLPPFERVMAAHMAEQVAALGEPWLSAFVPEQLVQRLTAMGFGSVTDLDAPALNARYFPRRKDGLQTAGGGLRVLCARVGEGR